MASAPLFFDKKIKQRQVLLVAKTGHPESEKVKAMLKNIRQLTPNVYEVIHIEKRGDCSQTEDFLWGRSGLWNRTVPLLFVNNLYFGDYNHINALYMDKKLTKELVARIKEGSIKVPQQEDPSRQEMTVSLRQLDQTEVCVELRDPELDDDIDDDDGFICHEVEWGFDPWDFDDSYDVVEAARKIRSVGTGHMDEETDKLKEMRVPRVPNLSELFVVRTITSLGPTLSSISEMS